MTAHLERIGAAEDRPYANHVKFIVVYGIALSALFLMVFVGADAFTAARRSHVQWYWQLELALPFVAWMVLPYLSLQILLILTPFTLRARAELDGFAASIAATIVLAGVGFVLVPAELGYPSSNELGRWADLFTLADFINLDYNLVPSLHVAFTVLCVTVLAPRSPRWGSAAVWCWGALIITSTLFTHQHHVLDVVTGMALGSGSKRWVFDRWLRRQNAPRLLPV